MTGITAVLPVWGRYLEYLPACLDNVAEQDGVAQVVIVANGCDLPIETPPDATIVRLEPRVPLGAAMNAGLAVADQEFVAFVDVDDLVLPGTFAFLSSRLTARPELVSVAAGLRAWDPETGDTQPYGWPSPIARRLVTMPRVFSAANSFHAQYPMASCAVHRVDAVRSAGGFPSTDLDWDWALANRLLRRGPVELHAQPGRLYRIDPTSLSHDTTWREIMRSRREVRRFTAADVSPSVVRPALKACWAVVHVAFGTREWRRIRRLRAAAGQAA